MAHTASQIQSTCQIHMKEKKATPSDALSNKHATPQIRRASAKKETQDVASTAGALAKSLDVLEMIMNSPYPPSAAQITEALQLPRPTTNRVISNLVKLSFLKRDVKYRELVEGDRLLKLALQVIARSTQRGPAHEILRELSSITRETCNIGTIVAGRIRYVDRVEADWPLSLRLEPGSYVPLHCTAIGKLLLASLPEPQREKHLQALTLSRNTEKTITRRDVLRTRLQEIVEQGYSIDDEEHLPGVIGMAVAVPTGGAYPILGIAVAVPTARASVENLTKHLPMLREYAARLGDCY